MTPHILRFRELRFVSVYQKATQRKACSLHHNSACQRGDRLRKAQSLLALAPSHFSPWVLCKATHQYYTPGGSYLPWSKASGTHSGTVRSPLVLSPCPLLLLTQCCNLVQREAGTIDRKTIFVINCSILLRFGTMQKQSRINLGLGLAFCLQHLTKGWWQLNKISISLRQMTFPSQNKSFSIK